MKVKSSKRLKKSFEKTLLDLAVPKFYKSQSKIKRLSQPLQPAKYIPQRPVPKPRKKAPVPMPSSSL